MLERRRGIFETIRSWFGKKSEPEEQKSVIIDQADESVGMPFILPTPKRQKKSSSVTKKTTKIKTTKSAAVKTAAFSSVKKAQSEKKVSKSTKKKVVAPKVIPVVPEIPKVAIKSTSIVKKIVKPTVKKESLVKKAVKKLVRKLPTPPFVKPDELPPKHPIQLHRYHSNPILEPKDTNVWESKATFNPAAVEHNGIVYLVYRAIGESDESVLGFAMSRDGVNIHERAAEPIYYQKREERKSAVTQVPYSSGGGWNGGCEDPRLTKIEDKIHLTYTAFDGWGSIRMALATISLEDFLSKKWDWTKPVFISPPGQVHKNWLLFPEKIKGKFAFLHSISPTVKIDYVDSLDKFDGSTFIESKYVKSPAKKGAWDSWVRGAGPPPIKTKHGWLLLYHAMDVKDPNRYKLGAMLLDLKDPTKVLFRSHKPILEPDLIYENEGFKWGVVYSCGAVVMNKTLYVYYGGADRVACVAAANLEHFLKQLMGTGEPKLKRSAKK